MSEQLELTEEQLVDLYHRAKAQCVGNWVEHVQSLCAGRQGRTDAPKPDERAAFEAWFSAQVRAGCLYSSDEDAAWAAWDASADRATASQARVLTDEPRSVEGMTRAEFEHYLRVGYQHDNVRAHVNAPTFSLTDDQKLSIAERVELNYPTQSACPGCNAFDSGASEVHFVHDCPGCIARMRKIAGIPACEICQGSKGGVQGNENVIDGKLVCDYCHADGSYMQGRAAQPRFPETFCSSCGKALGPGDAGVSHCGDHR